MITDSDVHELRTARDMISSVTAKIDCPYCRHHMDLILSLLDDSIDISRFNTLYRDDPAALQRYREIMQSERMLRLMAQGSRLVGMFRRIRHPFHHSV